MKHVIYSKLLTMSLIWLAFVDAQGQQLHNDKVSFGGSGRVFIENDYLYEEDTVNQDRVNSGYAQFDLAFQVEPNNVTEIQSVIRFRNEFGGFYGQGASVSFRQLYIRGLIANTLKYQFGDINLSRTPYTLFNNPAEVQVNESSAFSMLRDINMYENFFFENTWRQQGAEAEVSLVSGHFKRLKINGFITRNRQTNFLTMPEQLFGGGYLGLTGNQNWTLGMHYVNLFTIGNTSNTDAQRSNHVITGVFSYELDNDNIVYALDAEGGGSILAFQNDPVAPENVKDYFFDAGLSAGLKSSGLKVGLSYRNVGNRFYSAGAQTKQIDFNSTPGIFPLVTNDTIARGLTLFDITRDPTVYNRALTDQLMVYNPQYNNTTPYGQATPNRHGITLGITSNETINNLNATLKASYLQEVKGQGSELKKNFILIEAGGDLAVNNYLGWNKSMLLELGVRYAQTSRKGTAIEQVDLSSMLLDGGLSIEFVKDFELLLGAKLLTANGNEFLPVRDAYNEITTYSPLTTDSRQLLASIGLKYNISEWIFISLQGQHFDYKEKATGFNYAMNQLFVLMSMDL